VTQGPIQIVDVVKVFPLAVVRVRIVVVVVVVAAAAIRSIAYSGHSKDQCWCVVGLDHHRHLQRGLVGDVCPLGVRGSPIGITISITPTPTLARHEVEQLWIGGDSIRPLYRVGGQIGGEFEGNVLGGLSKAAQESSFGLLGGFVVVVVVVVVVVSIRIRIRVRVASSTGTYTCSFKFCRVGREVATGNPGPSHGRVGGHHGRVHASPGRHYAGVESHLGSGAKGRKGIAISAAVATIHAFGPL